MSHPTLRPRAGLPALLSIALLGGCAQLENVAPVVDARMGQTVRGLWTAQTLHPDAGRSAEPVAGLDGVSAVNTIRGYQASFGQSGGSSGASSSGGTVPTAGAGIGTGTR